MKEKFIPQFIPYWDENEIKAVERVLSKDYLNEHKIVREFEKKFAEFVGAKYCITCTSGTTALYIGLVALLEKSSIKSIRIPDYAGIFVANATKQAQVKPILTDVERNGSLGKTSNSRFVVHSNGRIGKSSQIEDCAQAISYHTKNCISCYSFASTKHITTGGQGGAVCCDSKKDFDILSRLKDLGRNDRQNLKPMSDHFQYWGFNSKFTEIQAAFGLAQLKKLPNRLRRLHEIYTVIKDELKTENVSFFDDEPKWYIDILLDNPELVLNRLRGKGIQARRFYRPLHQQPLYRKKSKKNFPNSNMLYEHGLWLPSTTNLTNTDVLHITNSLKKAID